MERVATPRKRRGRLLLLSLLVLTAGCKAGREPVSVFAAASLARAFSALEETFEGSQSKLDLRLEISGSQTACRKVSELNRRADVVAVADYRLIDRLLRPEHARFTLRFATNEVVLAHLEHSRGTERITAESWPAVLLEKGVRLGAVDPTQAPIGYRMLQVWSLAELWAAGRFGSNLAQRLAAQVAPAHRMSHEGELVSLLRTRTIDYAFVYRSTAEDQNLKFVDLDARIDLGDEKMGERYARSKVSVGAERGEARTLIAEPIVYGLTIPQSAANREGAAAWVELLLSERGRRVLHQAGFNLLRRARVDDAAALPSRLRHLVEAR